jgi:hypothetical protein
MPTAAADTRPMRGEAVRDDDPWRLSDGSAARPDDADEERSTEMALLRYAQRSAAKAGAEWFEAEFARREEQEQRERGEVQRWEPSTEPRSELVDASVEDSVVGGSPRGLGLR